MNLNISTLMHEYMVGDRNIRYYWKVECVCWPYLNEAYGDYPCFEMFEHHQYLELGN